MIRRLVPFLSLAAAVAVIALAALPDTHAADPESAREIQREETGRDASRAD